jgi:dolichol-phosphate mannosyltransferase
MTASTSAAEVGVGPPTRDWARPTALPARMLVFVVPLYNEAENLPRLLADFEARPALFTHGGCLILVDDGSTDTTATLAGSYGGAVPVRLVRLDRNEGPGAAFRAGFEEALRIVPDDGFVITLEGDTTSDLDALPTMLEEAAKGADVVLASSELHNVSGLRRFLSMMAGRVIRLMLGLQATTISSFFRAYRASVLRIATERHGDNLIRETGFACKAELLAKLAAQGARVAEVPVVLDGSRRIGKSRMPILRTIFAYWRLILRERFTQGRAVA